MNLSGPGLTYILLVIPTLFALVVLGQGIYKIERGEQGGQLISVFGVIFLGFVFAAYWFFIR